MIPSNPDFQPLVSVIMPAYNSESSISEAIDSVLSQTYPNWELIIVDDGSSDQTAEIVKKYQDSRIRYQFQENGGQSSARNTGIQIAKGELICFLDADDIWLPPKITKQVEFFKKSNDKLGLIHTGYLEFTKHQENKPKPLKHTKKVPLRGNIYEDLILHNFIGVLTVMVPTNVLQDVGSFDESLINSPDWDLWLRITKHYNAEYIDEVLAKYRLNPSGLSKNYEKYEKNLWKVLEKHLLKEKNLPEQKRKIGLWLYYRHMAHGLARNKKYSRALTNTLKAIRTRPFNMQNLLTMAYVLFKLIR